MFTCHYFSEEQKANTARQARDREGVLQRGDIEKETEQRERQRQRRRDREKDNEEEKESYMEKKAIRIDAFRRRAERMKESSPHEKKKKEPMQHIA